MPKVKKEEEAGFVRDGLVLMRRVREGRERFILVSPELADEVLARERTRWVDGKAPADAAEKVPVNASDWDTWAAKARGEG